MRRALEHYLRGGLQEAAPCRESVEHGHAQVPAEDEYERDKVSRLRESGELTVLGFWVKIRVSVQGVDQKPGFWCSTSQKLLAAERFSEANGVLWQEKPGFLAPLVNGYK